MLPTKDRLTICFAHVAYRLRERFLERDLGIASFQVRSLDELERRIGEADVLAVCGPGRQRRRQNTQKLRVIQSCVRGGHQIEGCAMQAPCVGSATAHPAYDRASASGAP